VGTVFGLGAMPQRPRMARAHDASRWDSGRYPTLKPYERPPKCVPQIGIPFVVHALACHAPEFPNFDFQLHPIGSWQAQQSRLVLGPFPAYSEPAAQAAT
jgi:hypothetical protein